MKEQIDDYLRAISGNRSSRTIRAYRECLQNFAALVGPDAPLNLDTYTKFLKKSREMTPTTQRLHRSAISGFYNYVGAKDVAGFAAQNQQLALVVHEDLINPDMEAIDRLITHCETMRNGLLELRDRAFVLTLVDTGLRISEACALNRGSVMSGKAQVEGKGGYEAVVRFSKRSRAAIREYLDARSKLDGKSGKPLASLPLFARHDRPYTNRVGRVSAKRMFNAIKARAEEAGVRRDAFRLHDLRHYFITVVYKASKDLKLAQELARHKNAKVTSRYAHLTEQEIDRKYNDIFNASE